MKKMLPKFIDKVTQIANDHKLGAAQLAKKACKEINAFAKEYPKSGKNTFKEDVEKLLNCLSKRKHEMAPLFSLIKKIKKAVKKGHQEVEDATESFLNILNDSRPKISSSLANLLKDSDYVITHSASSTVKNTIVDMHALGKALTMICTESRPCQEGKALAKDLGAAGVACLLIVDSAVSLFMNQANVVVVGADCVTEKYFVNKIGTLALALLAKQESIPFYVLADSTKFVASSKWSFVEKEKEEKEILRKKLKNVTPINFYFEKVPLKLITGIISEKGVLLPAQVKKHI